MHGMMHFPVLVQITRIFARWPAGMSSLYFAVFRRVVAPIFGSNDRLHTPKSIFDHAPPVLASPSTLLMPLLRRL